MDSLLTIQELERIYQAASFYKKNLVDKDISFIFLTNGKIDEITCYFAKENFAHLVGLKSKPKPKGISATEIYQQCLDCHLEQNRCLLTHRKGVVQSKLDIINDLMKIDSNCQLIAQLDETLGIRVKSDSLINTSSMSVMSFSCNGDVYIPNSALKRDIREISLDETRSSILCSIIKDKKNNYLLGMQNFKDLNALEMYDLKDYLQREHSEFINFDCEKYKFEIENVVNKKKNKLGYEILEKVAEIRDWKTYSIVDDDSIYDDGLKLIGYEKMIETEDVKVTRTLGSLTLDTSSLKDKKICFSNTDKENQLVFDLEPFLEEGIFNCKENEAQIVIKEKKSKLKRPSPTELISNAEKSVGKEKDKAKNTSIGVINKSKLKR